MKDREEFLASVYAKRDAELAQRKKNKKRMVSGLTAAAACLVLVVGVTQAGLLDFIGAVSSDGAAPEFQEMEGIMDDAGNTSAAEDESAAASGTAEDMIYDGAMVPDSDSADSDSAAPGTAAPNAAQEQVKDIYDISTDKNRDDGADSDSQYYYCLPCVTIEERGDGEAAVMYAGGIATVEKVQAWVERLEEQGQAFMHDERLADITLLKLREDVTCIVTIELEPQQKEVYYLTGEVGWYE